MEDIKRIDGRAALALAACAGLYPLLHCVAPLWAQAAARILLLGGLCAWGAARALAGGIPAFSELPWMPLVVAGGWLLSCAISPAQGFCGEALADFIAGLGAMYWMLWLPERGRSYVFYAVLAASWIMAAIALYQLCSGQDMTASFLSRNAFACWLLMITAVLYARGHNLQSFLFLVLLCLTHSRAALLAVAAVTVLRLALRGGFFRKILAVFLALCAGVAIHFMNGFSLGERYAWWRAALDMARARPWLGFGPGTFGYVYPAFHVPGASQFGSTFAHCWPLQLAAETGFVFAALWLGWIVARAAHSRGWAVGAAAAALVMSLADYAVVVGPDFVLFCVLLGSLGETPRTEFVNSRSRRLMLAAACLCAMFALIPFTFRDMRIAQALSAADATAASGDAGGTLHRLEALCSQYPREPVATLMLARSYKTLALVNGDRTMLSSAASAYEKALAANPFNPGVYDELSAVYTKLGETALFGDTIQRKAQNILWWKPSAKKN
jgi:hypothetical protein